MIQMLWNKIRNEGVNGRSVALSETCESAAAE